MMTPNLSVFLAWTTFALCHQALATGHGHSSTDAPQHPMIDFFAREGTSQSASHEQQLIESHDLENRRGKQIHLHPLDLELSLRHPGLSKSRPAPQAKPPSAGSRTLREREPLPLPNARRYHRFAWQRRLHSDAQVEEVYRLIGSKWGEMPRTTLDDIMRRLDRHLEAHPENLEKVLRQDKAAVEDIANATGRTTVHRGRRIRGPLQPDQLPMTVEDLIQRRKARPMSVAGMFGLAKPQRAAPKWGLFLARQDREKLVERLALVWGVPPEVVKKRMYSIELDAIRTHLTGILSENEAIYTQHAMQLLPQKFSVYVPHKRPRRPIRDAVRDKAADQGQ